MDAIAVKLRVLADDDARRRQASALDSMRLSLEEFIDLLDQACCRSCARPDWSERYDAWDEAEAMTFLLGHWSR